MNTPQIFIGPEVSAVMAGALLGLGSTISIGPNNLLLLREGLVRGRTSIVSGVVLGSSLALLLLADVAADLLSTVPSALKIGMAWFGLIALLYFALRAAGACFVPNAGIGDFRSQKERRTASFRRAALQYWLNPLCYLEYLIVPAAICGSYTTVSLRASFIGGLALMAVMKCYLYVVSGRLMIRFVRTPRGIQIFDACSCLILGSVATALGYQLIFIGI